MRSPDNAQAIIEFMAADGSARLGHFASEISSAASLTHDPNEILCLLSNRGMLNTPRGQGRSSVDVGASNPYFSVSAMTLPDSIDGVSHMNLKMDEVARAHELHGGVAFEDKFDEFLVAIFPFDSERKLRYHFTYVDYTLGFLCAIL
jgi:hypothetical protein